MFQMAVVAGRKGFRGRLRNSAEPDTENDKCNRHAKAARLKHWQIGAAHGRCPAQSAGQRARWHNQTEQIAGHPVCRRDEGKITTINGATIHGLGGTTPSRPAARAASRGAGFRMAEAPAETPTSAEAMATSGTEQVSLGGLLALQETPPGSVRDRAARRHGQRMLDVLRALQRARLGGTPDGDEGPAQHLAKLAAMAHPADDPRLAEVLRAIAVRAAVELARQDIR